MKSILILAGAATLLAACHPTAQDTSGRTATAADGPEAPVEPASAPVSAVPAVNADFAGPFQAAGTEPFWGLSIRPDGLTLTRPDRPIIEVANLGPTHDGKTAVWSSGPVVARLTPGHCADGMSDRDYPYVAVVQAGTETLKGCARPVR
jgi:uncharacterized membrane protein